MKKLVLKMYSHLSELGYQAIHNITKLYRIINLSKHKQKF